MDHEHQPTIINLPELLEYWGTNRFKQEFIEALGEHSSTVPLWSVCPTGSPAWDDDPEFYDLKYKRVSERSIEGSFAYSFIEETGAGCRDRPFSDRLNGRLLFRFDLSAGILRIEAPKIRAEYDPEEF